jgi:hypothetical protein
MSEELTPQMNREGGDSPEGQLPESPGQDDQQEALGDYGSKLNTIQVIRQY